MFKMYLLHFFDDNDSSKQNNIQRNDYNTESVTF